ncbi:hypothetical protein ACQP1P_38505 [Dactylosporangium sp. CA-052675]|uniref:hypothetical protein n=1 Tax=Dactylosporangium sp. CA-052675 TaxID=3239927 RepID=UPI003D8B171A
MAATQFVFCTELALGATVTGQPNSWSWTDVTDYVGGSEISISRGRADRFSDAQPDRCSLTFLNNGGRFVPRNPVGPYYGQLRRGTPLRVSIRPNVNSASDAFARTVSSSWGSADVGGAWSNVTGGTSAEFSVAPASGGRHTHPSAGVNHWSYLGSISLVRVDVTVRARVNALSTGAAQSAGVVIRYTGPGDNARGEIQFGTSGTLTARLVTWASSVQTVYASATVPGLTHSTSAWYRIRLQTGLTSVRMKVWLDGSPEPSTWLIDGSNVGMPLGPVAGAPGVYSLREVGNTNSNATFDFDDFSMVDGPRIQFTGFVDEWPVTWGDSALTQSYAPVTASGQLRRLSRAQPLKSAIYIATSSSPGLVGYWPMEDGTGAMTLASASGGLPGTFTNISLAASSGLAGSDPLPTLGASNGRVAFQIPAYTSSGSWSVCWVMRIPSSSISGTAQLMSWVTPGQSIVRWQLRLNPGSPDTIQLDAFGSGGGVTSSTAVNFTDAASGAKLSDGRQLAFLATGTQNGGNVDATWTCWYVPDGGGLATLFGGSFSPAGTTGRVGLIYHDSVTGFSNGGHTIGHVGLGDGNTAFGPGALGASGGAGQTTRERFTALLAAQGITPLIGDLVHGGAGGTATQQMGPQRTGDVLAQLREVEDTEQGVIHDSKQGFLEMLPRAMRYNRPVDLALDVNQGHVGWPFSPTDDNFLLQNDVTVTSPGGSSARSTDLVSIASQGVYADSVAVNAWNGVGLQQYADWLRNLGTTGAGLRYPEITLNLTDKHLSIGMSWLDTDIGSRITIANVPSNELPPDLLDLLVEGYTETISSTAWTARLNCSPGAQWLVGKLDTSTPRLDCGASTTSGAFNTTATSVALTIADECVWTIADGAFDIFIAGERMTVTNVSAPAGSGTSWTQTLTVTRSVNGVVKTHAAGEEVHVAVPIIVAL